jgi:hypothetical protein
MPFYGIKSAFGQAKTTAYVAERFFPDTITSLQFQPEFRPRPFFSSHMSTVGRLLGYFLASGRADYRYQTSSSSINNQRPQQSALRVHK